MMRPNPAVRIAAALAAACSLFAQDRPNAPEPKPAEPNAAEAKGGEAKTAERVVAVRARTIHPVAGPTIDNGVIVLRDGRIAAIGPAAEIEVPPDATVHDLGDVHVHPGLVDAWTDAFTDDAVRGDGSLDAASRVHTTLLARGDREDDLLRAGITTAYVGARSNAAWRGQGAVVRPGLGGFEVLDGREAAALHLRATNGPQASHALQRQQQIQSLFAAFDALEPYRKSLEEHEKALEKYGKEFADYLAFHEKKNGNGNAGSGPTGQGRPNRGATAPGDGEGQGAGAQQPGAGGRRRRGEGGGRTGESPPGEGGEPGPGRRPQGNGTQGPAPQGGPQGNGPANAGAAGGTEGGGNANAGAEKAPERPKYPKAPPRDPVKDALLEVLEGKLPLRVEAHREDEIRAVLHAATEKKIPLVVLENGLGAASVAKDLASAGVPVVLDAVWPEPMPKPYEGLDPLALPAQLERNGVAFAIASGSARRAAALPMMAALAVSRGLDEAAALRAITLTPAEILGMQRDVGSLQVGKRGDLLVTDGPLFASDSRVLAVWTDGEIRYDRKAAQAKATK